jgi:hypothetical protein
MAHLLGTPTSILIDHAYDQVGFGRVVPEDGVFRQLVTVRIIEPTSKQDSLVLFDCTTLQYECHEADEFRVPGYMDNCSLTCGTSLGGQQDGHWQVHAKVSLRPLGTVSVRSAQDTVRLGTVPSGPDVALVGSGRSWTGRLSRGDAESGR